MSGSCLPSELAANVSPTLWGLTPLDLHDRYWASRKVQVVRPAGGQGLLPGVRHFLLVPSSCLVDFDLADVADVLRWKRPRALLVKVRKIDDVGYREGALADAENRFLGYERHYGGTNGKTVHVALTRDREVARAWSADRSESEDASSVEGAVSPSGTRMVVAVSSGRVFDAENPADLMEFTTHALRCWPDPNGGVGRLKQIRKGVWADREAAVEDSVSFAGPAWIGAGRRLVNGTRVLGPAVLWDDPTARPRPEEIARPSIGKGRPARAPTFRGRITGTRAVFRRGFDVAFATVAILLTLPIYPFVMLAIYLQDGRPFFFAHWRETLGGRQFPCIKFRTMRKDAEKLKEQLKRENVADGPQFYIEHDPRMLRIGELLRKTKIDELPQFFNVILGHMAVVGPRPSPFEENQFCPAWREARLSVRPGITGLWQVMRTREPGLDFQEWIKYDIEYVEKVGMRLDLWILWRTIRSVIRGK